MPEVATINAQRLAHFRALCQKNPPNSGFWDLVILTALSAAQKQTYEERVSRLLESGLLPQRTEYRVVEDPPGPKIGSGGATLLVLEGMSKEFGEKLNERGKQPRIGVPFWRIFIERRLPFHGSLFDCNQLMYSYFMPAAFRKDYPTPLRAERSLLCCRFRTPKEAP